MSTTFIEAHVLLHGRPSDVRDHAIAVLGALGKHERPYDHLTIAVNVRDEVWMPIDAVVPVDVCVKADVRQKRWRYAVEILPNDESRFFPACAAVLTIIPGSNGASDVWMRGTYVAPSDVEDKGPDATFMYGSARRGLRAFLAWLSKEIAERLHAERSRVEQVLPSSGRWP